MHRATPILSAVPVHSDWVNPWGQSFFNGNTDLWRGCGVSSSAQLIGRSLAMPKMTLSYKEFPSGNLLLALGVIPVAKGAAISLSAFTSYTAGSNTYGFLFWDTDVSIAPGVSVTFTAPASDFDVDAWYIPEGPTTGPPGTGVSATAFSRNEHKAIAGTPIASVNISGAWSGPPSTTVSTTVGTSPVALTALAEMVPYGLFLRWVQFGDGTISADVLNVPPSGASMAIAFFGVPVPDPCQTYRDQMAALEPGDFPTEAAYKAALEVLGKELLACEEKYGEIAAP